ncbi:hypothetical protein ACQI4F_22235 [Mycolicibacterium vaccae]|uniref:hypothetical protein n=1 Tax=Mycolicibacterium vaccae TaxID=1810 RepID=UPI003CEB7A4B
MTELGRVLTEVRDAITGGSAGPDRGAAYRSAYAAGLRFAGLCVLDQIAAAAGGLTRAAPSDPASCRDRVRIVAALDRIAARLAAQRRPWADGESAAGYRDALAYALGVVRERREEVRGVGAPAGAVSGGPAAAHGGAAS